LSGVALHLKNWYEDHRYCGKCGSKTYHKADERALVCPDCGHLMFPKISPAIIVAIISGDRILLARNASFRDGFFSLVAGYTDVGETIAREVREEVGLTISNVRYYKSQPWAFSCSLMLGFIAEADDSQAIIPILV
jgi:NAD+ diphosphatase